jgi:hypothetical protein
LKNGRFFAPPRASRITTILESSETRRDRLPERQSSRQSSPHCEKPAIVSPGQVTGQADGPSRDAPG